jgi:hypothetical protein
MNPAPGDLVVRANKGTQMQKLILYMLPFLILGCATVYRQGTDVLPSDTIAVLEHKESTSGPGLIIEQVDGKWRGIGRFERYELMPGEHTLTVAYFDGFLMGTSKLLVTFAAVSGKTYTLKGSSEGLKWSAAVVEKESGVVVSSTRKK